jgi:ribosomal protein S18 acetylase RimI-like enzyme
MGLVRADEEADAFRLLARTFVDETLFAYVFAGRGRSRIEHALTPWFRAWVRAHVPLGAVHAARVEERLVGVGLCIPPGGVPVGLRRFRFNMSYLGCLLRMTMTSPRALQLVSFGARLERLHPKGPFWKLAFVGVDPEFQRRGIGGALVDQMIVGTGGSARVCWLVVFGPQARALFERRGFVVENEVRPFPDGPTGWTLQTEAAAVRRAGVPH